MTMSVSASPDPEKQTVSPGAALPRAAATSPAWVTVCVHFGGRACWLGAPEGPGPDGELVHPAASTTMPSSATSQPVGGLATRLPAVAPEDTNHDTSINAVIDRDYVSRGVPSVARSA